MNNAKHAAVTERIVEQLESGTAPWVRPWSVSGASGMPTNASTQKAYRGANVLTLWLAQTVGEYVTGEWVTFRQALALGGCVRKGETGTTVFYTSTFERTEDGQNGEEIRLVPFLKSYSVFNVAQCDGIAPSAPIVSTEFERIANAEAFVAALGANVKHGGDGAFYAPSADSITLPNPSAFESPAFYYATSLHEHAHWTGAAHRLNRTFGKRFGDNAYAIEELVAELTSAFLCAELGLPGTLRHPEYLAHWISVLKTDTRAIWTAGARASDAAAYLSQLAGRSDESFDDTCDALAA